MESVFSYITPEDAGVPSTAVEAFLDRLEKMNVGIHGFCLCADDKIFAEGYWKPFHSTYPHRMYSIGKSFTSMAIGLLLEEGRITLSDKICDYFSAYLPKKVHPYIAMMTIKHLLTMTTAHTSTTYKQYQGNWVESFFHVLPTHMPGTIFSYDTSATHVLAALVEKVTGMEMLEYLRINGLDSLGFSKEAYFIKDPYGVSQGGSGLVCTLLDMAKFAYVLQNGGMYKDKKIFPKNYILEATSKQIDTSLNGVIDEQQGYGYQMWRTRHNGFALYGLGGQLAVCHPESKLMLVTMGDTMEDPTAIQTIYSGFYEEIAIYFGNKQAQKIPSNETAYKKLRHRLETSSFSCVMGKNNSLYATKINGKKFLFEANEIGIKYFILSFSEDKGFIEFQFGDTAYKVTFGMNKLHVTALNNGQFCAASGAWLEEHTFHLRYHDWGNDLAQVKATLCFRENSVSVALKRTGQNPKYAMFNGFVSGEMENFSGSVEHL